MSSLMWRQWRLNTISKVPRPAGVFACGDAEDIVTGGPSAAAFGCWGRRFEAGLALGGTWAYLVLAQGAVANPPPGMVLTRSGAGALIVGSLRCRMDGAGTAVNAAIECYLLAYAAPLDAFAEPACPARLPN